jgi:two-component system, NarL family, sensor histidine kinase UhpB
MTSQKKSEQRLIDQLRQRIAELEKASRENEDRYRKLSESTTDMIYIADRNGDILYANSSAAAAMCCDANSIVGKQQKDLFSTEMAQRHTASIKKVFETGDTLDADGVYHFGPAEVWLNTRLMPLRDNTGQITSVMGVSRNITDRKLAEAELKKAHDELERRVDERTAELLTANEQLAIFRTFAEASGQGFGIADLDGRVTYVNPTLCRLMGEGQPADVVGRLFFDYVAEESRQLIRAEYTSTMLREGRWTREGSLLTRQGAVTPISNSSFLLRDEQGKPAYFATVISDITERKQAEESLRQSEEKYRGLLEACPDAVVMMDLNGTILFASRQTREMAGLSESEELTGQSAFSFVIEDDRRRLAENIPRVVESGSRRHIEYMCLRKDGTQVPVEISSAINRDAKGQPIAVMVVIRDITERKQAQEALRQSHDELQAIYDQVMDGIIIVDAEKMRPVHVNPAYCRMTGYSAEEMRTVPPEQLHPPDVLSKLMEHFEVLKKGLVARLESLSFLRKDGSVAYADVVSSPICYKERPCWIGFFHDVTDRKRAEEALRREHRTLKHLLQSSDHERQVIAYEIHDGLAQQLAGAIMQFQTYAHHKETRPKDAAKAYDAAMTMLSQGHSEARRLISGVRPPILDESGVATAIAHLVNEQRRQKGPQIELHSEVKFDRLAPIMENAIYRIVQEGLTNACTHSKSDRVRVELVQHGEDLQIRIQDWGTGFVPSDSEEERFGLAGIRERARLLGGNTTVESTLGQGTCITVELPLAARE